MEIRPFRGWRYCGENDGDVSNLVAPPYDVLDQQDKDELLAHSEQNIVAVDLPHVPPKELGPDEAYLRAGEVLESWKGSGVLCQDDKPALYAYEQTYAWGGKTFSRRAMICGLRAFEFGRDVVPHEQTFAGPKADRLRLTEVTRTQLSPIFGFYNDPQATVRNLLWTAAEGRPTIQGTLRDVTEKLWVVDDEGTVQEIASALRDVPAFIADGHHRCTTAMNYSAALRESGRIDENHEANYIMFCLVARDDPGLLVLPTHRIVGGLAEGFSISGLIERLPCFSWQRCSVDGVDLRNADAFLHKYGRGAMAFLGSDPAEIWIGKLSDPLAMEKAAPEELPIWRELDVAVLHKMVLDQAIEPWRSESVFVDYTPDGRAVMAACSSGRAQLGICIQGTPLEAVERIAMAGAAMPHKSTYFYPKLATGMVLKPLE